MARKHRLLTLTAVGVPAKHMNNREYWIKVKKSVRHSSCVCCDGKGRIPYIGYSVITRSMANDLPEGDYQTIAEGKEQEVMFGMCKPCYDKGGIESGVKAVQTLRGIYSPEVHRTATPFGASVPRHYVDAL